MRSILTASMKIHDLTEEQVEKLCNYIYDKYGIRDDNGFLRNLDTVCENCPFALYVGELRWYECKKPDFEKELSKELEKVIK